MLDQIIKLHKEGKFDKGLFEKTANMIMQKEMEKLAFPFGGNTPAGANALELAEELAKITPAHKFQSIIKDLKDMDEGMAGKLLDGMRSGVGSISSRVLGFIRKNKLITGIGAFGAMSLFSKLMGILEDSAEEAHHTDVFSQVMAGNPEFDQDKAQKIFSVLKDFSPTVASNPEAAAGYIQPLMEWPIVPHTSIKDLSQIEKNISDAGKGEGAFSRTMADLSKSLASLLAFGGD